MVRLTPELINQAPRVLNPAHQRELVLRGYRIPAIENMGATLDQYDCINLSDNDIKKLDGFPVMKRLTDLMLINNFIVRIASGLEEFLPNLECLILTENKLQELGDLDNLSSLPKLTVLSLLHCPVTSKQHYRLYVIHKIPQLKWLDFKKIKLAEIEEAQKLFASPKGQEFLRNVSQISSSVVSGTNGILKQATSNKKITAKQLEQRKKIKDAIRNASSLHEVERLNRLLESGVDEDDDDDEEEEEEEEEEKEKDEKMQI